MDTETKDRKENAQEMMGDETAAQAKERLSRGIKSIFVFALLMAVGYIGGISRLPFDARPFGGALLCAARSGTIPVFAGLCLSSLTEPKPYVWLAVWCGTLVLRILARVLLENNIKGKGRENAGQAQVKSRSFNEFLNYIFDNGKACTAAAAGICAFGGALSAVVSGGFLYYDIVGLVISVAVAPVAALVFSFAFGEGRIVSVAERRYRLLADDEKNSAKRAVGIAAICALAVFTLGGKNIYGIALSPLVAMAATLFFCRTRGMLFGGVAGLALGLAYSPMLSPIFVFTAFAAGALVPLSVGLGTWSGFAIGVGWGFYVKGISALSGLFSALLCATLIFNVTDKLFIAPKVTVKEKSDPRGGQRAEELPSVVILPDWALDTVRLDASKQKIKCMCETLFSLSREFGELSRLRRKTPEESCIAVCESAFESACAGCQLRDSCMERHRIGEEAERLSREILRKRTVSIGDVGKELFSVCQRLPDIVDEINHNCACCLKSAVDIDKFDSLSLDCAILSELLADMQIDENEDFFPNMGLGESLRHTLEASELCGVAEGVAVYGKRKKRITIRGNLFALRTRKEELLDAVEGSMPFPIDRNSSYIYEGSVCELRVEEAGCLSVSKAVRCESACGGDSLCGDSVITFFDDDGRFYSCISDGMGSGRRAAEISEICVEFMRRMLSGGNAVSEHSVRNILSMLNMFLRSRNFGSTNECSSTLDLFALDLVGKSAFFCKCGAASTYVFRSGSLFKLRSDTLPLGIIEKVDCKVIRFDVSGGDLVVMLSDGVAQGREECLWLFELLSRVAEEDSPELIADRVLRCARAHGAVDDLSVSVVKIKEKS